LLKWRLWKIVWDFSEATLPPGPFNALRTGFFGKFSGEIALWKNCESCVERRTPLREIFSCSSRCV
jgi:hypothetical protein